MAVLNHLEPQAVFSFFEQLCAIPHGSGNTKALSDHLVRFARARGLEHRQDGLNNVIIVKEASPGYEAAPSVMLQGHIDMVCEKAPECAKDMAREGLDLAIDGDIVYAKGTTLGGDDGIAVAMMLAILDSRELAHPRIEAVFTVDEETGMDGAAGLDLSACRARTMLNIDSSREGILTVGCACCIHPSLILPVTRADFSGEAVTVCVNGLSGGHSGKVIGSGGANADLLLGRVLAAAAKRTELRLLAIRGGEKDNAIPTHADAALIVTDRAALGDVCREMERILQNEYRLTDPALSVTMTDGKRAQPMDKMSTGRVISLLLCAPNGVQAMSGNLPGLVQTSLNLGILRSGADAAEAGFCVRSSIESQGELLLEKISSLASLLGGHVSVSARSPGWPFCAQSPLRALVSEVYEAQNGRKPEITVTHASLECGIFCEKLPGLDCVSIGPDLEDIHTAREKLHIASTQRTYALVTELLRRMKP